MSEQQKYNVVYAGAIASGFDEKQVRAGFVSQMKIPGDKVDRLFSGKRMTLKKSLSKQNAEVWQQKLLNIGAETAIIPFVSSLDAKTPIVAKANIPIPSTVKNKLASQPTSQLEYDEEMTARILKAKEMITSQQMEQQLGKQKESSPVKKLLIFSGVLAILVFFLYFYLDSMI